MRSRALFLITILAGSLITARAQQGDSLRRSTLPGDKAGGSIRGRVVLPSGQSVSSPIQIKLSDFRTPGMAGFTDSTGRFSFDNVPPGNYVLDVIGDPKIYSPVSEHVTINSGAGSQVVNLIISLRERGDFISDSELENAPASAKKEFEKAVGLIRDGSDDKAIEHLKAAVKIYPNYLAARNTLGAQYLKLKRLNEATEQLEAAIQIAPMNFHSRLHMGIVLVEQKKYSQGIDHLNKAVALDTSHGDAHLYLGIASLGAGDLAVAEQELAKALTRGQKYLIAHYYLAHVHLRRGDADRASAELKTYLEKSPDGQQAAHARALLEKMKKSG